MESTKFLTSCHVRNVDKTPLIGPAAGSVPQDAAYDDNDAVSSSSHHTAKRKKSHHSLRSLKSNSTSATLDMADVERHVMIFACTDTRNHLFHKVVSVEELFEIRETLDVNMTVGWWQFFRALKHCFLNHRVHLDFRSDPSASESTASLSRQVSSSSLNSLTSSSPDTCNMTLELHLPTLGRTSLTLKLQKVEETTKYLTQFFLEPLYEFFGQPGDYETAEKLERLEKQVKLYREKIHIIKDRLSSQEDGTSANGTSGQTGKLQKQRSMQSTDGETKNLQNSDSMGGLTVPTSAGVVNGNITIDDDDDENVALPTGNVLQLLREMQSKLVEQGALSETEKLAFNSVVDLLSQDSMYSPEFNQQAQREVDKEIITWLKLRFGADNQQNSTTAEASNNSPSTKHNLNLLDAADFLQSSNQINRSTTKQSIMSMFNKVDDWNFDVFTLEELTEGQTLFITSYTLFTKYDLLNKFRIDEKTLVNFLREIEAGYHPNPYHNSMHAADVLQVLHCIIYRGELGKSMNDEDIFAALLSAIIHDYDHPGLNNAFQVNSQSYLATLYNDRSVLENHHCAQAFELMKSGQYNILANLTPEQRRDVRETMIQMVLSTDMSQHVKYIGKFKQRIEARADFSSKEDLRLALQVAVKMADVSNPSRPQHLYLKWAERLSDEFFRQGDKEREIKVPISPLMDREKPSLAKGQIAFINYIITPMLESFCELLPKMKFAVKYVKGNRGYWEKNAAFPVENGKGGNGGEESRREKND